MRRIVLVPLLACAMSGCAGARQPWVEIGGQRYQVEIAKDDAARARGLMFRDSMPIDHGMLFIHDSEEPQADWMKNYKFPQDMKKNILTSV